MKTTQKNTENPKRLSGKVAVVTGAGSGIGRATALKFAQEGADVAILYAFDEPEAQTTAELVQAAGRRALVLYADVRRKDLVDKAFENVVQQFGRLDAFVNSAGVYRWAPFLDITEEDWDAVIDTNLKGSFLCAQAAARAMIALGMAGKIILISSTQAERPLKGTAHYGASKSGMISLMKTMALELAKHHIGVALICPGVIETAGNIAKLRDPSVRQEVESQIPWGRVGQPEEVANIAAYLCSDEAEYISGASFIIDGGLLTAGPQV
jgi:glucose 1-dehydrogenase